MSEIRRASWPHPLWVEPRRGRLDRIVARTAPGRERGWIALATFAVPDIGVASQMSLLDRVQRKAEGDVARKSPGGSDPAPTVDAQPPQAPAPDTAPPAPPRSGPSVTTVPASAPQAVDIVERFHRRD